MTHTELLKLFHYDQITGAFTNRTDRVRARAGAVAGCLQKSGYLSVVYKGKKYDLHRLAWLYVHGEWPAGKIDHIDQVKSNNAFVNLREVSSSGNAQNVPVKTKTQGIRFQGKSWSASLMLDGKHIRIGLFPTADLAHQAYIEAKSKLHPCFRTP